MDKVNIYEKLNDFNEYWSPKIVDEVNESYVKVVKLKGEFLWHSHKDEDEMFFVIKGRLTIRFRDRDIFLNEGEFLIIPKGIEHMPVAEVETHVMLIEAKTTLNTGDVINERTVKEPEKI
ncbi:cupin domain-containing protein [Desulforamulus ruminis]|uniref:Cupin 2 conserved barrel domain protein n=1 Tax=Desulforamulus ruminis (strain ATCC 23193 / DSM 2154 / NCIMB 8452 / DL) TaxID=696281 RepID=F6DMC7_DESRL|nr:cupin domain-containing protein [Desulforamulus ruminis]AEG60594.1 Cupin 2 conserved barrel domain protein [Desulforamulus ruminis DSM 2154]